MNITEEALRFAKICDAVERAWQHWPHRTEEDDTTNEFLHTSSYARRAATQITAMFDKSESKEESKDILLDLMSAIMVTFERRHVPELKIAVRAVLKVYEKPTEMPLDVFLTDLILDDD